MGHFTGPDVTSGSVPEIHAGLNYKHATYTLAESASASTTIAICRLPGGARVVDCTMTIDNANLWDTATAGASQVVHAWIAASSEAVYITTAQAGTQVNVFAPDQDSLGVRLTSSANVVIQLVNVPVGSGTTSTIFAVALTYDCQLDPDG